MRLNIGGRLAIGFSAIAAILVIAVSITLWKITNIDKTAARVVDLRIPTAAASSEMVKHIYASLASLRGYMLTGSDNFKKQRAEVWADIDETMA